MNNKKNAQFAALTLASLSLTACGSSEPPRPPTINVAPSPAPSVNVAAPNVQVTIPPTIACGTTPGDCDSDHIADQEDQCPTVAESEHPDPNRPGCPDHDTDNDGVFDREDACPTVASTRENDADNDGCPNESVADSSISGDATVPATDVAEAAQVGRGDGGVGDATVDNTTAEPPLPLPPGVAVVIQDAGFDPAALNLPVPTAIPTGVLAPNAPATPAPLAGAMNADGTANPVALCRLVERMALALGAEAPLARAGADRCCTVSSADLARANRLPHDAPCNSRTTHFCWRRQTDEIVTTTRGDGAYNACANGGLVMRPSAQTELLAGAPGGIPQGLASNLASPRRHHR